MMEVQIFFAAIGFILYMILGVILSFLAWVVILFFSYRRDGEVVTWKKLFETAGGIIRIDPMETLLTWPLMLLVLAFSGVRHKISQTVTGILDHLVPGLEAAKPKRKNQVNETVTIGDETLFVIEDPAIQQKR